MENASKALLIAGGILLALITISLLVYAATSMSEMAEAQDRAKLVEETTEFNLVYESYNRSRLYGTDVMSVVNRAIDYNKQLDTDEEEYFINIVIETTTNFETTIKTDTRYGSGKFEEGREIPQNDVSLYEGTYELRTEKLEIFFGQSSDDVEVKNDGSKIITTYTYSALTNFKNTIFTCEYVNYNESGRIEEMKFKQI